MAGPQPGLSWNLKLQPQRLDDEFWISSPDLHGYFGVADKWGIVSVTAINLILSRGRPWLHGHNSLHPMLNFGPAFFVFCAVLQRACMHRYPEFYTRHRTTITVMNLLVRMLFSSMFSVNGEALGLQADKQLAASRPAWAVVIALLLVMGPLFSVVWQFHFPLSFTMTLVSSFLWLVLSAFVFSREAVDVLRKPALQQGLRVVCQGVHNTWGTMLYLPVEYLDTETTTCAENSVWLVRFAQLCSFWFSIWKSYTTELHLKLAFLKSKHVEIDEPAIGEKLMMAFFCASCPYFLACFLQYVG